MDERRRSPVADERLVSQLIRQANDHIREALQELETAAVSMPPKAERLLELESAHRNG
jgi:hypothetical protein